MLASAPSYPGQHALHKQRTYQPAHLAMTVDPHYPRLRTRFTVRGHPRMIYCLQRRRQALRARGATRNGERASKRVVGRPGNEASAAVCAYVQLRRQDPRLALLSAGVARMHENGEHRVASDVDLARLVNDAEPDEQSREAGVWKRSRREASR